MSDGGDTVYLRVKVLKGGEASLFVEGPDGETFGVPRSQMRDDDRLRDVVDEEGDEGVIAIPRWLAEDREVEYVEDPDEA